MFCNRLQEGKAYDRYSSLAKKEVKHRRDTGINKTATYTG